MKATLVSKGWSGREVLHEEIVNKTTDKLNNYTSYYFFNALAYLPDDRSDRQCRKFPEGNVFNVGYRNLNFFVLYANVSSKETAEAAWEKLKNATGARDAVLDNV
ncbi:hypothetical protein AAVH_31322, partial [Aphelenchoides avenae]